MRSWPIVKMFEPSTSSALTASGKNKVAGTGSPFGSNFQSLSRSLSLSLCAAATWYTDCCCATNSGFLEHRRNSASHAAWTPGFARHEFALLRVRAGSLLLSTLVFLCMQHMSCPSKQTTTGGKACDKACEGSSVAIQGKEQDRVTRQFILALRPV